MKNQVTRFFRLFRNRSPRLRIRVILNPHDLNSLPRGSRVITRGSRTVLAVPEG